MIFSNAKDLVDLIFVKRRSIISVSHNPISRKKSDHLSFLIKNVLLNLLIQKYHQTRDYHRTPF